MRVQEKLKELDIVLPECPQPVGAYQPMVISNSMGFLSGQLPKTLEGKLIEGYAGRERSLEEAQDAARVAAINALSVLNTFCGFEKVNRILRVVGYVQCAEDFVEIPHVINGASNLFLDVFGDAGIHARTAIGVSSLPLNALVELELTVSLN